MKGGNPPGKLRSTETPAQIYNPRGGGAICQLADYTWSGAKSFFQMAIHRFFFPYNITPAKRDLTSINSQEQELSY